MLLSPEEAEARLSSPNNLANRFNKKPSHKTLKRQGRKENIPNLPPETRTEISLRANLGENQTALAQEFNTTQPRVSQLENLKDKSINKEIVRSSVEIARDAALEKLMLSMKVLTEEKLRRMKAKEIGSFASQMSTVVKNLTPEQSSAPAVQVVVFAPELRKEDNFKQVEI